MLVITIMASWQINGFRLFFFLVSVIILHRLDSLFFSLFQSLVFLLVRLGLPLSVGASGARKAEQSLSCSLKSNRRDTAESCLSSPALVCSHFISLYLLSGESADQCRCCEKTTTYTPLWHTFMSFTPLCSSHRVEPTREPFSAYASCHVRILDFCFELSWRAALYAPISWSNRKFPVVTSRLLTVCPLGWQRESEGNIGRRSCHTPISALMSHIKRCPYLNVILKGKTGGVVCVCVYGRYTKMEKKNSS